MCNHSFLTRRQGGGLGGAGGLRWSGNPSPASCGACPMAFIAFYPGCVPRMSATNVLGPQLPLPSPSTLSTSYLGLYRAGHASCSVVSPSAVQHLQAPFGGGCRGCRRNKGIASLQRVRTPTIFVRRWSTAFSAKET